MNWKNAFFVLLVAFVATLAWAVKQTVAPQNSELLALEPQKSDKTDTKTGQKKGGLHTNLTLGENEQSFIDCSGMVPEEGMLDSLDAKIRLDAFRDFINRYDFQYNYVGQEPEHDHVHFFDRGSNSEHNINPHSRQEDGGLKGCLEIKEFLIEKPCELRNLLNRAVDGGHKVFARLGIHEIASHRYEIDLVFGAPGVADAADLPSTPIGYPWRGDGGNYYYDFTTPCPPMCDSNQISTY